MTPIAGPQPIHGIGPRLVIIAAVVVALAGCSTAAVPGPSFAPAHPTQPPVVTTSPSLTPSPTP